MEASEKDFILSLGSRGGGIACTIPFLLLALKGDVIPKAEAAIL